MRAPAVIAAFVLAVAGCASAEDPSGAPAGTPVEGFPSLRDVPRVVEANTDAAHWQAVEADLLAAGEALRQSPRAQPPSPSDDPTAFLEEARRVLEQTRQAREPQ